MTRRVAYVCLAGLLLSAPAFSGKPDHAKGKGHGRQKDGWEFLPADRAWIAAYYRANPGQLPPGLARRNGDLPPGLEKQLRRNGRLPPGLDKRIAPFPPAIESRLPPCPPEVRRGIVAGMALMFDSRSGLVLDAFALVRR
jgi:hypothetical protein